MSRSADDVAQVIRLARADIRALAPYEHARWAPALERLHANESPWPPLAGHESANIHRYPEPQPPELLRAIATRYGVSDDQVLVGRGSDEAIDLLTRTFCEAGRSNVIVCPPTFGMYAVAARIQGAQVRDVPLDGRWQPRPEDIAAAMDAETRIVWLCSPNNPTGNTIDPEQIDTLLSMTAGRALLVVDEAYGEFVPEATTLPRLSRCPQLIVLRTLSKSAALAGARLGTLIAHPELVRLIRKVLSPYALPSPSIALGLQALTPTAVAVESARIDELIRERERVASALASRCTPGGALRHLWPSEANFLLVEVSDATRALARCATLGLIVRDFTGKFGTRQILRVTLGTPSQNDRLIRALSADGAEFGDSP